jgi:hypothetical protein
MDKPYSVRTPMVIRAMEKDKDPFRPKEEEEVFGPEYPCLSAISALMYLANNMMYLANNTRSDIAFVVNYLARHSAAPTMHH